jgi:hypothetical protein
MHKQTTYRYALVLVLFLHACGNAAPPSQGTAPQAASDACSDTWESYGSNFFASNCLACHMYMSRYAMVNANKTEIRARIASGSMPQGKPLSSDDKTKALAFIDCGLPRATVPPQPPTNPHPGYCRACTNDNDCDAGAMCLAAAAPGTALCGNPCQTDIDCDADAECDDVSAPDGSSAGKSCYPKSGMCPSPTPNNPIHVGTDAGTSSAASDVPPPVSLPSGPSGTSGSNGTSGASGSSGPSAATGPACTLESYATEGALFSKYCGSCHAWAKSWSGIAGNPSGESSRLSAGSMPPSGNPKPTASEKAAMLQWLNCGAPQ